MKNCAILLVLTLCVIIINTEEYDFYKDANVYTLNVKNLKTVSTILESIKYDHHFDIWDKAIKDKSKVRILVPKFKQQNFELLLDINDIKFQKISAKIFGENERKMNNRIRPKQNKLGISFEKYHRFDEINNYLENLTKVFKNISKLIDIGETYEGRTLKVLHISTGGSDVKPAVFIDGGIHAREWISPAQVLYIINQLVENSKENYELIDKLDWYILPVINADGYEYTHTTERFWRKTRRPNQRSDCVGTDPNRNFDFHWGEIGSSISPCSEIYAGDKPFSEKATQALRDFGLKISNQTKLYLTFHSFGNYILYPWGYTYDLPENADELQTLGDSANAALNYEYTVGSVTHALTPGAGGSDDWFKGVPGIDLVYCIELPGGGSNGFDLPADRIFPVVTHTYQGVKVFAEYVIEKYVK